MINKKDILDAWIMVELLSEGDINIKDKKLLQFDDLKEEDYYDFFGKCISKELKSVKYKEKSGIAVYFNIFEFEDIIKLLRKQYGFREPEDEIRYGHKFNLVLYFDKDLSFLEDLTFFTVNGYINDTKKVPDLDEFKKYEEEQKTKINRFFAVPEDDGGEKGKKNKIDPVQFNEAIGKVLSLLGGKTDLKCCRIQVMKNIESEAVNLHSFFVDDLEKAKTISTENLDKYLLGMTGKRINLDSKKDSEHFHPEILYRILQPENYPLGRFPGKTEFGLCFMQQIAVNLSIGFDNSQMRSVNGPPGTGKTTLLKDIFADFVVKQAHDICQLPKKVITGTEETKYFQNASIGMLPDHISENGIIVASSNNGAVQNIVKELPVSKEIDAALLPDLKEADYFTEIANASKVEQKWVEKKENMELTPGEESYWGLFSLEGGRSDNMKNILFRMKAIYQYFDDGKYESAPEIYEEFEELYTEVENYRKKIQNAAFEYGRYLQDKVDYNRKKEELAVKHKEWDERIRQESDANYKNQNLWENRIEEIHGKISEIQQELIRVNQKHKEYSDILDRLMSNKPGFLVKREIKDQYHQNYNIAINELTQSSNEKQELEKQQALCRAQMNEIAAERKRSNDALENLKNEVASRKTADSIDLSEMERRISKASGLFSEGIKAIDFSVSYDDLQKTNPWFSEEYRVLQSKLFIAALKVRKQFLYENRKNVRAATNIWNKQDEHAENKKVILAAWHWINLTIPVISSTFASFSRMCRYLGPDSLGHLFVDEAGQALPQAGVGAIFRCKHVMVVGDPEQIKPVLTLEPNVLRMLGNHFSVSEKYLSESASVQTLVDAVSQFGYYRDNEQTDSSWIGIPLWVHRRCQYPMFSIANKISYNNMMVHGEPGDGKTGWFNIKGTANNKYVEKQGEFLLRVIDEKIKEISKEKSNEKKEIYVITPFANVAYQLARKLDKIGFTKRDENRKPTNVGTIHTFQGKEAAIVFMVLGADTQSKGAASWAVSEPNMMNVAATRAKKEFYIIGDKELYLGLGSDVVEDTYSVMRAYQKEHSELCFDEKSYPDAPDESKNDGTASGTGPAESHTEATPNTAATADTEKTDPEKEEPEKVTENSLPKPQEKVNAEKKKVMYVGNNTNKSFHRPTCIYAPKNPAKRVEFSSKEEALQNGYKSCSNCHS